MIAALAVGATAGLGLLLAVWALVPPRLDLAAAVGRFDIRRADSHTANDGESQWTSRLGQMLASAALHSGFVMPALRANLTLGERSLEQHLVRKVLVGLVGLILPVAVLAVLAVAGIDIGWTMPLLVAVALAAGFSFLPDLSLKRLADARRNELRRSLACYLDLVSMSLAGGRGVPEALPAAVQIGRGWAFDLIGNTLSRARYSGVSPWDALAELGERVGVNELRDLGGALSLVADDGAKIRESLRARAATARARQLAESEGDAERGSESIRNAHLLLGFAFLVFLAYPAVAAVMAL